MGLSTIFLGFVLVACLIVGVSAIIFYFKNYSKDEWALMPVGFIVTLLILDVLVFVDHFLR